MNNIDNATDYYLAQGFEPIECEGWKVFHKYNNEFFGELVVFCRESGDEVFCSSQVVNTIDIPSLLAKAEKAYEIRKESYERRKHLYVEAV